MLTWPLLMDAASLNLYIRGSPIGIIDGPYLSDGTWYGRFRPCPTAVPRVAEYIWFCIDWNERARAVGADASEFDKFAELMTPGTWTIVSAGGEVSELESAPIFFAGGDITWG